MCQIDNISLEWQELFDLSGIKRQDLEDANTLQFILDFVASQGGLSGEPTAAIGKKATESGHGKPMQKSQLEDVTDSGLGPDAGTMITTILCEDKDIITDMMCAVVVGTVRRRTGSRTLGKERRTLIAQQLNKRLTQLSEQMTNLADTKPSVICCLYFRHVVMTGYQLSVT